MTALAWIFYLLLFLVLASFMNVLIYRLPLGIQVVKGRSKCPHCGYTIKWYDNIPILSYLLLGGKCRHCKKRISPRYIIVEMCGLVIPVLAYLKFGYSPFSVLVSLLLLVFVGIFIVDGKEHIIPDTFNVIIFLLGIVSCFVINIKDKYGIVTVNWHDSLISIGVNCAIFLLVRLIEKICKREIIGGGDLKLFFTVGLFMGYRLLLLGIVLASLIGTFVEVIMMLHAKRKKTTYNHMVPFGPYLVLGFTLSLFFGADIIAFFVNMLH